MTQAKDPTEFEQFKAMFLEAAAAEAEQVASLLTESANEDLLGATELALRDAVHRIGAKTLQKAANQRAKKTLTKAAASPASAVSRPAS